MGLKNGSVENAQPAMKDETKAAPAAVDEAPGAQFDHGTDADPDNARVPAAPAASAGGPLATQNATGSARFGSLDNKLAFGAFPQVKLDKASFVVGDDEGELTQFDFKALGAQTRTIYKNVNDDFFFTYDNVTATDGKSVKQHLADWDAEGAKLKERRDYQEVYGYIMNGEFAERMVILSVPPASVPRLAGVRTEALALHGLELDQIILDIGVGGKIKTKAGQTFHPWSFKFKCKVTEYAAKSDEGAAE